MKIHCNNFNIFFKRLQYGINKGLDNNLIITKVKKAVKINHNARDVKKEVIITFEIKEKVGKNSYYICSQGGGIRA